MGDGADAVLRRERLLFVNVDFADLGLAVVFIGEFVEQRRNHFTGATPFRPKIHEDGRGRLQDVLCKVFVC